MSTDYPEYPTEEDLKFIREFKALERPVMELVEYIERIWHYGDWGFKLLKHGQEDILGKPTWRLELHTGGWSGNESIIETLMQTDWWKLCWERQSRGGHYLVEIPKWLRNVKTPPEKGE